MTIPRLPFAFALVCALVAGALAFAGTMAGCDRAGTLPVLNGAVACPDCPLDPNRAALPDCTQAIGVDTLPVETFNDHTGSAGLGAAEDLYKYTDGTSNLLFEDFFHDAAGEAGFEPPVVSENLCDPPALGNGVLHMFGGPFLSWGGGIGIAMQKLNGRDPGNNGFNVDSLTTVDPFAPKGFCCVGKPSAGPCQVTADPKFAATCPPSSAEYAVYIGAIDVSGFEGVSFWARRGYTGQAGIRINVGDKHTDDDLNYLAQRQQLATGQPQPLYCQRVRECACRNHQDCSLVGGDFLPPSVPPLLMGMGAYICATITPQTDFASLFPAGTDWSQGCVSDLNGGPNLCCNTTACSAPYSAYPNDLIPDAALIPGHPPPWPGGDPQYYGRPCTPYAWPNGIGSSWCFDPARDPPPADPTRQCGDHWESVVTLDTDWHFYKVPFTDMHQQGFAQKSEQLDLHSVSVVRFTWDVGYVDDWIDDVSFYRAAM